MKKKFLLALSMVALIICILAITVSAKEFDKAEKVTVKLSNGTTQECAIYDENGNELTWYTLDGGATLISIKTSDLVFSSQTELRDISLADGTELQKVNETSVNKIVVGNFRGLTFNVSPQVGYKTTFMNSTVVQYLFMPATLQKIYCNAVQNCKNLVVYDIPTDEQLDYLDTNSFNGCSSIKEINLGKKLTLIGGTVFYNCTSLEKVYIDKDSPLKSIGGSAFENCSLIQFGYEENVARVPNTVTDMGNNVFKKSKFTVLYLPTDLESLGYNVADGNTNLTDVYMPLALTSWNVASFVNCTSLERVHGLEELFTGGYLTEIPSTTFYGCTSLEYLFENNNFPSGIVTIGGSAFENCTSLKTPTFPETLKVTGANSFKNCDALGPIVVFPNSLQTFGQTSLCGCDNIEVVYMGANVTAFGGYDAFNTMAKLTTVYMPALTAMPINTFRNSSNLTTVYYTGTKEQLDLLIADGVKTSGNDYFTKLTPISAKEYEQLEDKIGKYIIYDYNKCDAFYGSIHLEDNNPCVINCAQCNTYGIVEKNPIHSEVLAIVYENGYASKGVKNVTCANEGCNHNVTSEAQELFICFGYSSSKVGNGGMLMAFAVNHKAIEEFEGVSKSSVSYGVFAGLKDRLSTNDAVTADGKAQNGAICADYTEKRFDIIEIKVAGFTSNEHMDAQIVLGAYVIVKKGEETTISYLQDKKPLDNEKYVSRSYNQLID